MKTIHRTTLLALACLATVSAAQGQDWILQWEALERQAATAGAAPRVAASVADDGPAWLRGRALVALAAHEPQRAAAELERFAGAKDPTLRLAAAEAAALLADDRSRTALDRLAADADPAVALAAAVALARRSGEGAWRLVRDRVAELDPQRALFQGRILVAVGSSTAATRWDQLLEGAQGEARDGLIGALAWAAGERWRLRLQGLLVAGSEADRAAAHGAALGLAEGEYHALLDACYADQALHEAATRLVYLRPAAPGMAHVVRLLRAGELAPAALPLGLDLLRADLDHAYPEIARRYLAHEQHDIRRRAVRLVAGIEDDQEQFALLAAVLPDPHFPVVWDALDVIAETTSAVPADGIVAYARPLLDATDKNPREQGLRLIGMRLTEDEGGAAIAALTPFLRGDDKDLRRRAREALQQVGGWRVAQALGYVPRWQVLGPFDNDDQNAGFARALPPEQRVDLAATYPVGERHAPTGLQALGWKDAAVWSSGELMLHNTLPPPVELNVAYAYAEFSVDAARAARLEIAGDDAVAVWLNGTRVFAQGGERVLDEETKKQDRTKRREWWDRKRKDADGWYPAVEGTVEVQLARGRNRLLVKCANLDIYWWFRVRLTDAEGKPLEVDW